MAAMGSVTTAACDLEMRQGGEAASGQPAWSGVCSGHEGDPVRAVARHMKLGMASRPHAESDMSADSSDENQYTCDWCRRRVDRRLRLHVSSDNNVPVSAGENCCDGVSWHEDGDWIELCCLCYHVPNPGTLLTSPWNPCCCGATSHVCARRLESSKILCHEVYAANPPKYHVMKYVHAMAARVTRCIWHRTTICCILFMT